MKILVISNYPTPSSLQSGIFVYNFVQELVDQGQDVTVISPKKITIKNLLKKNPYKGRETLYQPLFLSFSNKKIFGFNTYSLTHNSFVNIIKHTIKAKNVEFDVVYAHFFSAAFVACDVLKNNNKPLFLAIGESIWSHWDMNYFSDKKKKELMGKITGFISVSIQNYDKLISLGIRKDKILYAPNATNLSVFYPRNKFELRCKYRFPLDANIIIFVGTFNENKGYLRVLKAIENIDNVYGIFLGAGDIDVSFSNKILFKGIVNNNLIPEYLSCSDIFVLPTKSEGSCNAIVEAMACGLPIISSNISSIKEQCNDTFSVLVEPSDIYSISEAIKSMINDRIGLREMSNNALEKAKDFSIENRTKKIIKFINKIKNENCTY